MNRSNYSKHLSVDHNHKTKQVRGLLCTSCNSALGLFRESAIVLKGAINYLKKYEKK